MFKKKQNDVSRDRIAVIDAWLLIMSDELAKDWSTFALDGTFTCRVLDQDIQFNRMRSKALLELMGQVQHNMLFVKPEAKFYIDTIRVLDFMKEEMGL